MSFRLTTCGAFILGLVMVAPQVATSKTAPGLQITDAWMNPTAVGQAVGAGYLQITNRTGRPDALVGASSPSASAVQMHTISLHGGVAKMRQVSQLTLPLRGKLTLAPGGSHLMLLGLKKPLSSGQKILVTLRFASGKDKTIAVTVVPALQRNHSNGEHHDHH